MVTWRFAMYVKLKGFLLRENADRIKKEGRSKTFSGQNQKIHLIVALDTVHPNHAEEKFTSHTRSSAHLVQYNTVTEGWLVIIQGSTEAHILECYSSCLTRLVSISARLTPRPDTEPLTRIDCPQGAHRHGPQISLAKPRVMLWRSVPEKLNQARSIPARMELRRKLWLMEG